MADFNEAYWVTVGTAAPVIGLAHAVVLGQYLRLTATAAARSRFHKRWALATYIITGVGFVTSSAPFLLAMLALAREDNESLLLTSGVMLVVSLWAVAFAALSAALASPSAGT